MCEAPTLLSAQPTADLHSCWIIYRNTDGKELLNITGQKSKMVTATSDDNVTEDVQLGQLLEPELRPESPIPGNEESEAIYREHQQLGNQHLRIFQDLCFAQLKKEKILLQMDPVERQQKQELLKKMSEKEDLLRFYNDLKQQLDQLHLDQANNQQTLANPNQGRQSPAPEFVADDGWVVIQSPKNT